MLKVMLFGAWFLLVACVGPTTPLGAINSFVLPVTENSSGEVAQNLQAPRMTSHKTMPDLLEHQPNYDGTWANFYGNQPIFRGESAPGPVINFIPDKQVLHDRSDLVVEVVDHQEIPRLSHLRVFFNELDMTEKFMSQSRMEKNHDAKSIRLVFQDLRLRPADLNNIKVEYHKSPRRRYSAHYLPPACRLSEGRTIAAITGFTPPDSYVDWISLMASEAGLNPGLIAGIVAQESGFNPNAVSWAKAIGLTQITPVAEQQIIDKHKGYPQFPGINKLGYVALKAKIMSGEINSETEWRLNPKRSINGGISYIKYLKQYWSLPQNQELINQLRGDRDTNLAKLILASYNSGAARVKAAVVAKGNNWMHNQNLREANKYVNRVSSFCYHFSREGNSNDNET